MSPEASDAPTATLRTALRMKIASSGGREARQHVATQYGKLGNRGIAFLGIPFAMFCFFLSTPIPRVESVLLD